MQQHLRYQIITVHRVAAVHPETILLLLVPAPVAHHTVPVAVPLLALLQAVAVFHLVAAEAVFHPVEAAPAAVVLRLQVAVVAVVVVVGDKNLLKII